MAQSQRSTGPERHLAALESMRGVAAMMVLAYHLVLVELAAFPSPTELGIVRNHFGLGVPPLRATPT